MQLPNGVRLEVLAWQRGVIAGATRAAGRDPSAIHTYVRINAAAGTSVDEVPDANALLADNGYPDVFVASMYMLTDTDAQLDWVERLSAR